MKKILTLILLLFTLFVSAQNIAFIYQDSILNSLKNYKKNINTIEKLKIQFQNEIQKEKNECQKKIENLIQKNNLVGIKNIEEIKSKIPQTDLNILDVLLEEDNLISKKAANYDLVIQIQFNKDVLPLIEKVNLVLKKYAEKNKISIIYSIEKLRQTIAYIDTEKDITKNIINLLN